MVRLGFIRCTNRTIIRQETMVVRLVPFDGHANGARPTEVLLGPRGPDGCAPRPRVPDRCASGPPRPRRSSARAADDSPFEASIWGGARRSCNCVRSAGASMSTAGIAARRARKAPRRGGPGELRGVIGSTHAPWRWPAADRRGVEVASDPWRSQIAAPGDPHPSKRSIRNGVRSWRLRPSRDSSAASSPMTGANLKPWPEQAETTITAGWSGWGPRTKWSSGALV